MSKSNKVENKNGTNVEMLDAYKCQHMTVRNFNALTLTRTFSPSLLFLFSTFSFFGIFMFRHFYFRPKLGLPFHRRYFCDLIIVKPLLLHNTNNCKTDNISLCDTNVKRKKNQCQKCTVLL